MVATLHLPGALPRPLTTPETEALGLHHGPSYLQIADDAPLVAQLFGSSISYEPIACGAQYLVVGLGNAGDFDFPVNASANRVAAQLTGIDFADEPLVGPILIVEA